MRIVGGYLKSRILAAFKGDFIRPTADNVRESLFNIIGGRIRGAAFLDLFCGTGAVGIEALSRGAERVVLNDRSKESLAVLKKNLSILNIEDKVSVSCKDAAIFVVTSCEKFDIIYIDPPYAAGENAIPKNIADMLNDGGTAVFESETPFSGKIEGLVVSDRRKYGRVHLTFFIKTDGDKQ